MTSTQNIISIQDFLAEVKSLFEIHISQKKYTIKCEVSKIKLIKGNYYFDLIDFDQSGNIVKIRGTLFDNFVINKFLKGVSITDYNDLISKKLVLHGNASFHKTFGISLNISSIDIEYFLGEAEIQKQKIIKELKDLGLFDRNKNLKYSFPPFKIAVISSKSSEGLKDFETILKNSKFNYEIEHFYSNIHGDKSIPDIINALKKIISSNNEFKALDENQKNLKDNKYDFVAIIRGGGGSDGMNWANNIEIVKLVSKIDIPVITAIGHTSDKSILDLVAKYPCKTPSEGAKIIMDIFNKYKDSLLENKKAIYEEFRFIALSLKNNNKELITFINNRIQQKSFAMQNELHRNNLNIQSLINKKCFNYRQIIDFMKYKIDLEVKNQIKSIKNNLNISYNIIKQYDYSIVLKKGYNLTLDKNTKKVAKNLEIGNNYILKNNFGEYEIKVLK